MQNPQNRNTHLCAFDIVSGEVAALAPGFGNVATSCSMHGNQADTYPGWRCHYDLLQPFANLLDDFPCAAQFKIQIFPCDDRGKTNGTALGE
jgi:hypothetical protein